MKIKDLIKVLEREDQDREVILASDPEGNNHYLLPDNFIGRGFFDLDNLEYRSEGNTEDCNLDTFVKALCIYP